MSEANQFVRDVPDGCTVSIRLQPGAKRDTVIGLHGEAVKIALSAPPIEGRANEALIEFLAGKLNLPRSRVALIAGASSRSKVVRVTGKSAADVRAALLPETSC